MPDLRLPPSPLPPPAAVEEVKLALLTCLAAWLPKCAAPPPAAVQQLAAGLSEPKEGLRRGTLRAAAAAVAAAPGLAGPLGPLATPLAKLVGEGCAKAVARADGVAALLLAAQVAAADSAAGVWGAVESVWGWADLGYRGGWCGGLCALEIASIAWCRVVTCLAWALAGMLFWVMK